LEPQNLAKQCHEALLLAILAEGSKHGYQLALEIEERSDGYFRFNHGTLYPILHKLEQDGLIRGKWKREGPRRKRKLYGLTPRGRDYADSQLASWREFYQKFFDLVGGNDS